MAASTGRFSNDIYVLDYDANNSTEYEFRLLNGRRFRIGDAADGLVAFFDGASQFFVDASTANDTIEVGSTTNTDVRLHGDTAGADIRWDASADQLIVTDAASIRVGDAADGFVVQFDGDDTLNIDPANANDIVRVGETTQADVQVDGATDLLWDASAGLLTNGGRTVSCRATTNQEAFANGANNPTAATFSTQYTTSGGASTGTLGAGTINGQLKSIHVIPGGTTNAATITVTNLTGGNTVTLTPPDMNIQAEVLLMWSGAIWEVMKIVNGTVSTVP